MHYIAFLMILTKSWTYISEDEFDEEREDAKKWDSDYLELMN